MSRAKRQSLLAWVVGVVLVSILCAHAISPDLGKFRENVSRGPLLAQEVFRPAPWISAAPFAMAVRAQPSGGAFRLKPQPARLVVPVPKATPAYRYTFRVLSAHPEVTDRYDEIILQYADRRKINPRLIKAIIAAESEFSNEALSPRGARGLMQILPRTAEELGVPGRALGDPDANIRAGSAYLEALYAAAWKRYRLKGVVYADAPLWVMERIIASYNAGPHALNSNRCMRQTRNYVRKVLLFYRSGVSEFRRSPRRGRATQGPREDMQP